jgi:hypothetical protein
MYIHKSTDELVLSIKVSSRTTVLLSILVTPEYTGFHVLLWYMNSHTGVELLINMSPDSGVSLPPALSHFDDIDVCSSVGDIGSEVTQISDALISGGTGGSGGTEFPNDTYFHVVPLCTHSYWLLPVVGMLISISPSFGILLPLTLFHVLITVDRDTSDGKLTVVVCASTLDSPITDVKFQVEPVLSFLNVQVYRKLPAGILTSVSPSTSDFELLAASHAFRIEVPVEPSGNSVVVVYVSDFEALYGLNKIQLLSIEYTHVY